MTDREKFEAYFAPIAEGMKKCGVGAVGIARRKDNQWQGWQAALASQQPVAAKEVFNLGHCTHEPDFTRSGMICTSDEQAAHQQADDGWIQLEEGAIPVHPETLVEIKMRNGATDGPGKAGGFLWYIGNEVRDEMGCDIIAYRVVKP